MGRKRQLQSTLRITTLGGASEKCPYSLTALIPEVSLYVLQFDGTLLWAWKFCRYSRIVVISAVAISEVDCTSEAADLVHTSCNHNMPVTPSKPVIRPQAETLVKVQNMSVGLGLGANVGPGVISDKRDQTDFHINMPSYVQG